MSIEIERKYLLTDQKLFRELTASEPTLIHQGYLSLGTDTPWTTRVRVETDPDGTSRATLTAKLRGTLQRQEVETDLDIDVARQLFRGCTHRINKERYRHDLGDGLVAEVDVFLGANTGLILVEVELPSVSTKTPFDGVLEDVTEDPRYANSSLASSGLDIDSKTPRHPAP